MTNMYPLLRVIPTDQGYSMSNRTEAQLAEGAARLIAERRFGSANHTGPIKIAWECGKLRASYLNLADREKVSAWLERYLPGDGFTGKMRIWLKDGIQSRAVEVIPD